MGELAVDGFFVVSGFLVTRSALRLRSLRRFAWHRALRILPGFWVCLVVVGFVVAPLIAWVQGRPPGVVLAGEDSAPGYVVRNAGLLMRQWDVAGLVATLGGEEIALDGALWTLWYEALCYAGLAVLVAVVPMALRRYAVAAGVAAMWLLVVAVETGTVEGAPEFLPRFALMFGLGALGWLFADRVRFTPSLVVLAAAAFGAGVLGFADYRAVGAAGFAYLLLWAVVALPVRIEPRGDLSYGMYVYHWPVQQVLVAAGATALGLQAFTLLALGLAAGAAALSWCFVERPALACKDARWVDAIPLRPRPSPGAHAHSRGVHALR
jgi:peptidoglycan/LPS O-acetylase OafA/YrhL